MKKSTQRISVLVVIFLHCIDRPAMVGGRTGSENRAPGLSVVLLGVDSL